MRSDLPPNRFVARDILRLEQAYGAEHVFWDERGRWLQLTRFLLRSPRYAFNREDTYVLMFPPEDYGERAGTGAGIEEFYIHRDLRIRRNGRWQEIPHTYADIDRRDGAAVGMQHRYACCHIRWDPRRHTVLTSLTMLGLFLGDPWTFENRSEAWKTAG